MRVCYETLLWERKSQDMERKAYIYQKDASSIDEHDCQVVERGNVID